jgi:hypothetical protein
MSGCLKAARETTRPFDWADEPIPAQADCFARRPTDFSNAARTVHGGRWIYTCSNISSLVASLVGGRAPDDYRARCFGAGKTSMLAFAERL